MALDAAMADWARERGTTGLRLYTWAPACVSIGRHESTDRRLDRAALDDLGVQSVRRPTGGRAVWHEHDLTFSFATPVHSTATARAWHDRLHQCIAAALQAIGIGAVLAPAGEVPGLEAGACFAHAVGGEVLVDDLKVVGSAQLVERGTLLHQGTILLAGAEDQRWRMQRAAGRTCAPYPRNDVRRLASRSDLEPVLVGTLADALGAPGELSASDLAGFTPPWLPYFTDPAWTWSR
jgi:lipoate-protein ligase A